MPHSPCAPTPTEPPAGAGGGLFFWSLNFLRSSSCESSKDGRSPGRAGIGGVWKYGCSNASIALMRFRQSSFSNSLSNEIARSLWSLKTILSVDLRSANTMVPSTPGRSFQPGMFWSSGDPTRSKIICAWCRSLPPAKIGLPLNISPKTQPTPHMSIAVVYWRSCSRSSGGRYHLVTTRVV